MLLTTDKNAKGPMLFWQVEQTILQIVLIYSGKLFAGS